MTRRSTNHLFRVNSNGQVQPVFPGGIIIPVDEFSSGGRPVIGGGGFDTLEERGITWERDPSGARVAKLSAWRMDGVPANDKISGADLLVEDDGDPTNNFANLHLGVHRAIPARSSIIAAVGAKLITLLAGDGSSGFIKIGTAAGGVDIIAAFGGCAAAGGEWNDPCGIFTNTRTATGSYQVDFSGLFSATPIALVCVYGAGAVTAKVGAIVNPNRFTVGTFRTTDGINLDLDFAFLAIGPTTQ